MKKQIAVLMAAATAVTTVAPALANAEVKSNDASVDSIVKNVREKLNVKYKANDETGVSLPGSNAVADVLNSRYAVLVKGADKEALDRAGFKALKNSDYKSYEFYFAVEEENDVTTVVDNQNEDWYVVDDASKLANVLENSNVNTTKVAIVDKGAKDGLSYRVTGNKHYVAAAENVADTDTTVSLGKLAKDLYDKAANKSFVKKVVVTTRVGNKESEKTLVEGEKQKDALAGETVVVEVELTLTSGTTLTFRVGDDAIDLNEAREASGNPITESSNDSNVWDRVAKFETIENDGTTNKAVKVDIPDGDTDLYTYEKYTEEKIELNNVYTKKDGYTQEGADFVNSLVKVLKGDSLTFNFRGVSYELDGSKEDAQKLVEKAKIKAVKDGYELSFSLNVKNANDTDNKKTLKFVITGANQKDLADLLKTLKDRNTVTAGYFTRLYGPNRFSTAVSVSQEQFNPGTAKSVVIVGGYAQMDGLAAAPLASAKNAPILLADPKTGLSNETLAEIDRACVNKDNDLKNKTVYIVGGEKSVPNSVVKQLEEKFGAVVVRVSGQNRYETSLEVARRLKYDGKLKQSNNTVYVVGGEGAADAMSISSVASKKSKDASRNDAEVVSPILVVNKNGITRSIREFVKTDMSANKAYLVGGTSSLSSQVFDDFKMAVNNGQTIRLSGSNRYGTNVEVIKEFYTTKKANGVIVASGEDKYLVDAQTSGAFASYGDNNYPIVLSGSKLTSDQEDFFKKNGLLSGIAKGKVYQVGGVVNSNVMSYVVDKLGL